MKKIQRLQKEANEAAEWRGHKLKWSWEKNHEKGERRGIGICTHEGCTGQVVVFELGRPIDMMGDAVAINCGDELTPDKSVWGFVDKMLAPFRPVTGG